MPIPEPTQEESKEQFIARCMADEETIEEFPDTAQRRGVCETQWDEGGEQGLTGNHAFVAEVKRKIGPTLDAANRQKL